MFGHFADEWMYDQNGAGDDPADSRELWAGLAQMGREVVTDREYDPSMCDPEDEAEEDQAARN